MTAFLRRLWSVGGLLSEDGKKTREDHRHHLVDAVTVALTGPKWVKRLAEAASQAQAAGRRKFASIEAPWAGFAEQVRAELDRTVVSMRVDRKVRGPLHKETYYGLIGGPDGEPKTVVRKPVHALSMAEVARIVDERVRERVQLQLNLLQQGGAENTRKLKNNWPTLPTREGGEVSIKRVRICIDKKPRPVGAGPRRRNVVGGDLHHFEIFKHTDSRTGRVKFGRAAVSIQEAMEHVKNHQPVVRRDHGDGAEFLFSIAKDEVLEIERQGVCSLVRVRTLESERRADSRVSALHWRRPPVDREEQEPRTPHGPAANGGAEVPEGLGFRSARCAIAVSDRPIDISESGAVLSLEDGLLADPA